jgi:hypothetical protein
MLPKIARQNCSESEVAGPRANRVVVDDKWVTRATATRGALNVDAIIVPSDARKVLQGSVRHVYITPARHSLTISPNSNSFSEADAFLRCHANYSRASERSHESTPHDNPALVENPEVAPAMQDFRRAPPTSKDKKESLNDDEASSRSMRQG